MSYILDALKKSEAERSRGVVPTLLTPSHATFRSSVVGWGLIAALVINAGLFAAWLYWPRDVATTTTVRVAEPPAAAIPDRIDCSIERRKVSVRNIGTRCFCGTVECDGYTTQRD